MKKKKRKKKKMAKRYNEGKPRYDLIPALAQEELAKVLTVGAEKYGIDNWRKGMSWNKVLASLERHLYAFKRGEDRDLETGILHSAHIQANAAFLTEYFYTFPDLDDRFMYIFSKKGGQKNKKKKKDNKVQKEKKQKFTKMKIKKEKYEKGKKKKKKK